MKVSGWIHNDHSVEVFVLFVHIFPMLAIKIIAF